MTASERKRLIGSYWDLPVEVQQATARFLVGSKLSDIIESAAHQVVEYDIGYHRNGKFYNLVFDGTNGKMLGGNEHVVIQEVLKALPAGGRDAVNKGGASIRKLKIKHDDQDDREYIHVEYLDKTGLITNYKLEMDGRVRARR
ncbi:hypothetical protein [Dongia sp.]|uniref:hypothetical protein n=1 Tax=Dongia sp. TaxID=1977262 RepID=UPI0035B40257